MDNESNKIIIGSRSGWADLLALIILIALALWGFGYAASPQQAIAWAFGYTCIGITGILAISLLLLILISCLVVFWDWEEGR